MTAEIAMPLLMRWLHVGTAIVVVGGLVFYRLVFVPIADKVLSDEEREKLREPLMRRWKIFIHASIILFLISGFYNYIYVTSAQHEGQGLYHALFGLKFLLALGVFALAIIMTSTMTWSEKFRKNQALWAVLILLASAVVLIGGYMKVMPAGSNHASQIDSGAGAVSEEAGDL